MYYKRLSLFIIALLLCGPMANAQPREKVVAKALPLSSQLTDENVTYEIRDNLDLNGQTVSLPAGSSIRFKGGTVKNGKIRIDRTTSFIDADGAVFEHVELLPREPLANDRKVRLAEVKAVWFGAVGDNKADDTQPIQAALNSAHNLAVPVRLSRGYYRITSKLLLREGDALFGDAASPVNSNNQKTHTIIRYHGRGDCIVQAEGRFIQIRDLILSAATPYTTNGINVKGPMLYLNLSNVMLGNVRYGINSLLDQNEGFSQCLFDGVRISNCIRGVSVDITSGKGQYITYNRFYNVTISNAKEKGVYLRCRSLNSTRFMDCNIANIGYGDYCDAGYAESGIYAIEAINEGRQGSVSIIGGYFENLYYSKDGNLDAAFDYENNAAFCFENISATIMDARLANVRTTVRSKGNDMVKIINCIDNGYLYRQKGKGLICAENPATMLDIDGYAFTNKNKDFIRSPIIGKGTLAGLEVRNVRYADNSVQPPISYNKTGADAVTVYISDDGDGSGLSEKFPTRWTPLSTDFTRSVSHLRVRYTSDVTMPERVNFSGRIAASNRLDIDLNGHTHKLTSEKPYGALFEVANYSACSIRCGMLSKPAPNSYLLYLSKPDAAECRIALRDIVLPASAGAATLVVFTTNTPWSRNTFVDLNGVRNSSANPVKITNRPDEVIVDSFRNCSGVTELIAARNFQSGTLSGRPKSLPPDRAGFIYQATDGGRPMYMWNGNRWLKLNYTQE